MFIFEVQKNSLLLKYFTSFSRSTQTNADGRMRKDKVISMKYLILILIFGFFLNTNANAQYFQTGQDPSSIRWHQINTANFQVIYPDEFENEAQRVAFVLDKVFQYGTKTLNHQPKKISVVLHTRTVNSNGLVGWAPKRIELFTTPNQQIYSQDWLEQLALHEFRHSVQMDKIQSEMPFLLKAIFGEQATAAVVGAYLPFWFLEGDAVVTETALSKAGRGRSAAFGMEYRAQLVEKEKYSFDKAYLGSYRDFVPDYYKMGYLLVGKTREKFGAQLWEQTLDRIGNSPFSLTPLNSTVKKISGLGIKDLYNNTFDELRTEWKKEISNKKIDTLAILSPKKKNYTAYLYPEIYNDSLIFAYRTSLDDIGRFVLVYPDKTEKIVFTPGYPFEESVSLRNNLVIWAEQRADLRWTHAEKSVIRILDLENRRVREIKPSNKLFCPVISPDLKMFAAVEVDPSNDFYLSVFDLATGNMICRFKTDDNQYFFTPCWDDKGTKLFVVCLSNQGKYLASYDLKNKQLNKLTDATYANLSNPVYHSDSVIFSSDFSGTTDVYRLDLHSGKIQQIAGVPFGAFFPTVSSDNKLIFCNYNSSGFQLASLDLSKKDNFLKVDDLQLRPDSLAEHLAAQDAGVPDFSGATEHSFPTKKYSKVGHLFNFHSWAPAYIDVDNYETRPGFSFLSQNKLGTAETRIGYDYNTSEETGQYRVNFTYRGLFPEITTEFITGKHASNYLEITNTLNARHEIVDSDTTLHRYTLNETSAKVGLSLPLNLSRGKYSRSLYPEIQYTFNRVSQDAAAPSDFYSGDYHAMTYRIFFANALNRSQQSLITRWGQKFDFVFKHTPFKGNDLGTMAGVESVLYFPGLAKNHGLRVYQGFQDKVFSSSYSFSDLVSFPRGFQSYRNNRMYSLAVDYKFPISYPDLSIGKLFYIKRLRSSLFYDFAWLALPAQDQEGKIWLNYHELNMKSMGIELMSDLHVLRFFAPISVGLRTAYRPDYQDFQFNLLLSVNFNGF